MRHRAYEGIAKATWKGQGWDWTQSIWLQSPLASFPCWLPLPWHRDHCPLILLSDSKLRVDHPSCPFKTSGDFSLKALRTFCFDGGRLSPLCECDFRALRETVLFLPALDQVAFLFPGIQFFLQRNEATFAKKPSAQKSLPSLRTVRGCSFYRE